MKAYVSLVLASFALVGGASAPAVREPTAQRATQDESGEPSAAIGEGEGASEQREEQAEEELDEFVPSEEVSWDDTLTFPVDI